MPSVRSAVYGVLTVLVTALTATGALAAGVAQAAPTPTVPTWVSAPPMAEPVHTSWLGQACTATGFWGTYRFDLSKTPLAGQRIDGTYSIHRLPPPGSGQSPLPVGTFTIRCAR